MNASTAPGWFEDEEETVISAVWAFESTLEADEAAHADAMLAQLDITCTEEN